MSLHMDMVGLRPVLSHRVSIIYKMSKISRNVMNVIRCIHINEDKTLLKKLLLVLDL